jgi:hypothetical protein
MISYKGLPEYNQKIILAFKDGKLVSKEGSFLADIDKIPTEPQLPQA